MFHTRTLITHHSSHTTSHIHTHLTQTLISHLSSHTTHLPPIISHYPSHTAHPTPLHSSQTVHLTPLISHHSSHARISHHSSPTTHFSSIYLTRNSFSAERHKTSHVGLSSPFISASAFWLLLLLQKPLIVVGVWMMLFGENCRARSLGHEVFAFLFYVAFTYFAVLNESWQQQLFWFRSVALRLSFWHGAMRRNTFQIISHDNAA